MSDDDVVTRGPDVLESMQPSAAHDQAPEPEALSDQSPLVALQRELELARAREARLQLDNHRLAKALEEAERELADLATLREDAELGRRAHDAAIRLQMLEGSASWRLTRPLRSIATEARRAAERWRRER